MLLIYTDNELQGTSQINFKQLLNNAIPIKLPPSWYRYTTLNNNWVGFSEIIIEQTSDSITPVLIKDIIVESTKKIYC